MKDGIDEKFPEDEVEEMKKAKKRSLLFFLKITLFLVCLCGFSYQASEFLHYYWTYPAVVELRVERDRNYIAPAATYCFINNVTRTNYCERNNASCYVVEYIYQACDDFPEYCKVGAKIPDPSYLKNASIPLEDLIDLGTNISDIMIVNPWGENHTIDGPFYYGSWWSIRLFTCYTLNSLADSDKVPKQQAIDSDALKEDKYSRSFVGYFYFNWTQVKDQTVDGITFHLHSPFNAAIPPKDFVLRPGRRYEVVMSMEEEYLLPAPYGTDCINYTTIWENAGRKGFRSEKICKEYCEVTYDSKCTGCVNIWNLYPFSEKPKCFKGIDYEFLSACNESVNKGYKDCVAECRMECAQLKYDYTIKELQKDAWDYRGYHPDFIQIDMYVKPEILVYTHRAQIKEVELFSYIGGYMGIWLGISLFALADILKSSYSILLPWMYRMREVKRSASIKSIKNWRASMISSGSVKKENNDKSDAVKEEAGDEKQVTEPEVKVTDPENVF